MNRLDATEMLARYRRLRDEQGFGWGEPAIPDMFGWARFSRLGPVFDEVAASGDWAGAVRAAVGDEVPPGLVLVAVAADGALDVRTGAPRPAVAGSPVQVDVVLDSTADPSAGPELVVRVGAGGRVAGVPIAAGGAGLRTLDVDGAAPVITIGCAGHHRAIADAVEAVPAAALRLTSEHGARWSVTDATGGAWFAPGAPRKWDAADRPFFHTDPGTTELAVRAGPLRVVAARGLEFERLELVVEPGPDERVDVDYRPPRRFDPAAAGWCGADLHVHLNYSGDQVLHPRDAARMQRGEGLHLMQLTAGNFTGPSRATPGTRAPTTRGTGRPQRGLPVDSRPRRDHHLRAPCLLPAGGPGRPGGAGAVGGGARAGRRRRAGPGGRRGAGVLLRRPRRPGAVPPPALVRAAVGRDRGHRHVPVLRARSRPGVRPTGWGRVYAQLEGAPLSVEAFTDAIRAGRTVVTNGPWLEVDVDGSGPGAVLGAAPGDRLAVRARVRGSGVDRLVLHGPGGELAASGTDALEHVVTVGGEGLWLAAAAHGGEGDPHTVGAPVFAHTSPVYVDVGGRRPARAESARWCLAVLDGLRGLVEEHGRFDPGRRAEQLGDLLDVLDRARAFYLGAEATAEGPRSGSGHDGG
ncbi:hypothetical protein [Pseudonocardia humida]|uniref:Uncharacterized protein n=1 Tax=Pseudonocardia humida TaxID=2800819 RepID=A0ABT1A9N2_9PSEU|nr:hypothetical protein [Pseudonocardia humida]MCO1659534.1 hypothetical protein [Pseudonocardia humida]